jgi:alkyl hydroperoxide reductase subunit AhpF
MFVHIGSATNTQMQPPECTKNEFGNVEVGLDCATNIPGLFAAGDVTNMPHKQIIIAAGQGAAAALSAVQYLNRLQ